MNIRLLSTHADCYARYEFEPSPQLFFDCDESPYKLSVTDDYRLKLVRVLS